MTLAATWLRLKIDLATEIPPLNSLGSNDPKKDTRAASVGKKIIPAARVTGKDMLTLTDFQTRTGAKSTAATIAAHSPSSTAATCPRINLVEPGIARASVAKLVSQKKRRVAESSRSLDAVLVLLRLTETDMLPPCLMGGAPATA
jgi:hypothetical protein